MFVYLSHGNGHASALFQIATQSSHIQCAMPLSTSSDNSLDENNT
jgi:hypothetical protein